MFLLDLVRLDYNIESQNPFEIYPYIVRELIVEVVFYAVRKHAFIFKICVQHEVLCMQLPTKKKYIYLEHS